VIPDLKITSLRIKPGVDDKEVTVAIKPKYSEERRYALPRECLDELRSDLERLGGGQQSAPVKNPGQITIKTPKKFMVGSGLPKHPVIFLVFDPQTELQGGYALDAEAAMKMADQLVKQAEAVKAQATGGKAN
jgi:hypothetical protein